MFIFPATLTLDEDDGGYIVSFRDVPEALTQGDTLEEAMLNASEALDEAFAGFIVDGDPLPKPSKIRQEDYAVSVPTQTVFKFFLRSSMKSSKLSNIALSKKLGVNEKEVRRIIDPKHNTAMGRLEKALNATGQQPVIAIVPIQGYDLA
tara:strand:- start:331 stop:777 length:447 start_codon:yes stop_codon:yes gene_type:complete